MYNHDMVYFKFIQILVTLSSKVCLQITPVTKNELIAGLIDEDGSLIIKPE